MKFLIPFCLQSESPKSGAVIGKSRKNGVSEKGKEGSLAVCVLMAMPAPCKHSGQTGEVEAAPQGKDSVPLQSPTAKIRLSPVLLSNWLLSQRLHDHLRFDHLLEWPTELRTLGLLSYQFIKKSLIGNS